MFTLLSDKRDKIYMGYVFSHLGVENMYRR